MLGIPGGQSNSSLGQSGPGPANPGLGPAPDLLGLLAKSHDQARDMFDATGKAVSHIAYMKSEFTKLAGKGAALTGEDVIDAAGRMVARGGVTPQEMSSALADLPPGGQALQAWVQQHLQKYTQMVQQVQVSHDVVRHEVGMSGLRHLTGLLGKSGIPMDGGQGQGQTQSTPDEPGPGPGPGAP